MFNDKFISLIENIKDLGISCEQLGKQYISKISTLEGIVTQQEIQIKKLQKQLEALQLENNLNFIASPTPHECISTDEEPEPYPGTHPIRVIPKYSKVRLGVKAY